MQLRMARLCLDCEEVHDAQQCPVCASESFAFLTRWIPAPDRRTGPRPVESHPSVQRERLEAVRGLTRGHVLTGSLLGITTLGVLGWLVGRAGASQTADEGASRDRQGTGPAGGGSGTPPKSWF
jgi:hypothetical protein